MTEQEKQPRYFYEGQTVYSANFGKGVVVSTGVDWQSYPVTVRFLDGKLREFTYDGRAYKGHEITLSQNPIPEIINQPLPEIPDLKEGDVVVCWDDDKESAIIGIFKSFSPNEEYPYEAVFQPGKIVSRWSVYKNCEKYDPEKHYKQN